MAKHHLIGKLCQYKSEHRNKVLFTFDISKDDIHKLEFHLQLWQPQDRITSKTMIPTWYYNSSFKGQPAPKPSTYHTPYFYLTNIDNNFFNNTPESIQNFLIVDSCTLALKFRNKTINHRVFLKALLIDGEDSAFHWLDADWVEPYTGRETYMDDLKAKLLAKLYT